MNQWCSQHNSRVKWRIHYKRLETISERWRSNHTLSPLFLADDITAVEFMSDISYTTSNSMSEATLQRLCKKNKTTIRKSVYNFPISVFPSVQSSHSRRTLANLRDYSVTDGEKQHKIRLKHSEINTPCHDLQVNIFSSYMQITALRARIAKYQQFYYLAYIIYQYG